MFQNVPIAYLIPTSTDLAAWVGVFFATFVFLGIGRLVSRGQAAPEIALIAGWGAACIALTIWGVLTPTTLRIPAIVLVILGAVGLVAPTLRLSRREWLGLFRIAITAVPLLLVMASAQPSLTDTFAYLLPNAAYLYDHGSFPADARPPAYSSLAGAPYNMQLAAFVAALVTPGFPPSAMIGLNLLFQVAAGLLLARLVARGEVDRHAPPSWTATAAGFLLAMALNPGFIPREHLWAYSEPSVTVAVAFAGWLAVDVLERAAAPREARSEACLLALVLAALVNIKQESVALAVGVLGGAIAVALARPAAERGRAVGLLAFAAVPAVILYLAWRWYVLSHFALGELKLMPMAQWQVQELPLIFWSILRTIGHKAVFFATLGTIFVTLIFSLRRHGLETATRTAAVLAGVFVLYNGALVFAYVAHFAGKAGTGAHNYFRYNTHLSLLMMVSLVLYARAAALNNGSEFRQRLRRIATPAVLIAVAAAPILFISFLRFDLEEPQIRVRALASEAASRLRDGDRVVLLLPGDDGTVAAMLETALQTLPPRRSNLVLKVLTSDAPDALASLAADDYRIALVSCVPPGTTAAPAGTAALVERDRTGAWHHVAVWHYIPRPYGRQWSRVLAEAPLCLKGDEALSAPS